MDLVIKAVSVVCRVDREALLALGAGQLVTRRLVVIRIRNHACHQTENSGRVDLYVARVRLNVAGKCGNIRLIRLIRIHILNGTNVRLKNLLVFL